jgi:hypothetical protein
VSRQYVADKLIAVEILSRAGKTIFIKDFLKIAVAEHACSLCTLEAALCQFCFDQQPANPEVNLGPIQFPVHERYPRWHSESRM